MERNISGKTAVITGAGSGIGKAIAKKLSLLGAEIILLGGRTRTKLENTKDEIIQSGGRCEYFCGDLTDPMTRDRGIAFTVEKFGKIDILINNAGSAMNQDFEAVSEAQFDEIMNLDFKAPFFLTQSILPFLKKSDYAMIINIASVVAHLGYPNQSVYSAAKHALIGFSKSLAREVYRDNIRIHVISPGGVYTDMVKLTRPDLSGESMILPEDIADTVAFLVQNRGNAVIDEIILHRVGKEPFSV